MNQTPHVSHVEWRCTNLDTTRDFLSGLFGWRFLPFGNNYYLYTPTEGTCVGLIKADQVVAGNNCLVFIKVDSIESYLYAALGLDSKIVVPKTEIVEYGWYAQITDPDQNIIGLFEALDS